ncbi:MAG: TetR/AcrR family transcriptional regulator [Bifidobacteriaceae bacterium]|jgi:AcrR family transcriptional regulator|nr:TetR/AcrR family transcriptional regulator [Bifidobacteriaceae bacterium]
MRRPDAKKIEAIERAVLQLTRDEGLAGVSFSKIARLAHVSPATAYVYYQDKTDMLSQMYLQVKRLMDQGLAEKLSPALGLRERFELVLWHFARSFEAYPLEANFMRAVQANPHFVRPEAIAQANAMIGPLIALFEEAVAADALTETEPRLVVALTFAPMTQLIEQCHNARLDLSDDELGRVIRRSLDAIFLPPTTRRNDHGNH